MPLFTECVEVEFSEVRRSKRSVEVGERHLTPAWREPCDVQKRRLCSVRCTVVYQAVATRNGATTGEILTHRAGAMPYVTFRVISEDHTLHSRAPTPMGRPWVRPTAFGVLQLCMHK